MAALLAGEGHGSRHRLWQDVFQAHDVDAMPDAIPDPNPLLETVENNHGPPPMTSNDARVPMSLGVTTSVVLRGPDKKMTIACRSGLKELMGELHRH